MSIPRYISRAVVITAWLMFVVSFFLPWTNGWTGWQVSTSSIAIMFAQPLIIIAEPRVLLFLAFPFINLTMLAAPLFILTRDRPWVFSGLFLLFGFLPWAFPEDVTEYLLIGAYLWDASFFAMAACCILESFALWRDYQRLMRSLHERAT